MKIEVTKKSIIAAAIAVVLIIVAAATALIAGNSEPEPEIVGKMTIKVNPQFDLYYDIDENVVKVEDDNEEAGTILEHLKDYKGRALSIVTEELVTLIGEAGFLDGVDGAPVPITVTFAPAEGHEDGWEPPTELADDVLDVIEKLAFDHDWQTNIIVKAAEEVLAEKSTVIVENIADPEASDETSEEESSEEEVSKPEESSKPVETSKTESSKQESSTKPVESSKTESSENVSVKPDPTPEVSDTDDEVAEGDVLTPEQLEALKYCSRCGKPKGDGTDGTCKRWLSAKSCPLCGTEVDARECHSCP